MRTADCVATRQLFGSDRADGDKSQAQSADGGRQICILPIGVDAGDQVGHCGRRASQIEGFDRRPAFNPAARPASVSSYV